MNDTNNTAATERKHNLIRKLCDAIPMGGGPDSLCGCCPYATDACAWCQNVNGLDAVPEASLDTIIDTLVDALIKSYSAIERTC